MLRSTPSARSPIPAVAVALLVAGVALHALAPAEAAHRASLAPASLPAVNVFSTAASDGTFAYAIGGHRGGPSGYVSDIVRFDPATGEARVVANMNSGRYCAAAAWTGQHVYILGGYTQGGSMTSDVIRFTPGTNTVTLLTGRLPTARTCAAAVWDGQNVYLFGGDDPNGFASTVVRFSPASETGAIVGSAPGGGGQGVSAVYDGRHAYLFGKCCIGNQIVKYDLGANAGSVLNVGFPSGRAYTSAVWTGREALVIGGQTTGPVTDEIVRFDPATLKVTVSEARLPSPRMSTSAAWTGREVVVFGGENSNGRLAEIVRYDPNNAGPTAALPALVTAECVNGRASVRLDASGARDPDGDAFTLAWSAPGIAFDDPGSPTPTASFPLGETPVTLTLADDKGHVATAATKVRVEDTLPPAVALDRPRAGLLYVYDQAIRTGAASTGAFGPLTVVAAVADACGAARVAFSVSDGSAGADAAAPYSFTYNPVGLPVLEEVTVSVTATDASGQSAAATATFLHQGTACRTAVSEEVCARLPVVDAPLPPDSLKALCRMVASQAICGALFG